MQVAQVCLPADNLALQSQGFLAATLRLPRIRLVRDCSVLLYSVSNLPSLNSQEQTEKNFQRSMTLKRIVLFAFVLAMALSAPAQTTFGNVQSMNGWTPCTGCAGGGANASFVFKQGIASPSMDAHALLEGIRG